MLAVILCSEDERVPVSDPALYVANHGCESRMWVDDESIRLCTLASHPLPTHYSDIVYIPIIVFWMNTLEEVREYSSWTFETTLLGYSSWNCICVAEGRPGGGGYGMGQHEENRKGEQEKDRNKDLQISKMWHWRT